MNKTIKTLVALLPLFITSCYNDDTTVTTNPQQDRVVAVNAGITREGSSTTGSDFASGDKILITNVTRKDAGLICNSAVFTCNGSSWTMSEGTLLWSAGEENTFQAVYPSTASYSSFTVPSDQSDADKLKSADWMTCEKTVTLNNLTTASPLELTFERRMAMVVVEITGASVNTLASLTVVSPSSDNNNITFENQDHKITAYKDATNDNMFSAIIAPGSKSSGAQLCTLSLSNSTEKSLKLQSDINFEAGKKYTFQCSLTSQPDSAPTRSAAPDNLTLVSVEPM
ncbi:MAG: fimbrillin family protein [Prevotella sp.]|nr:fimbrillin family protein [Prevotella sp.]